MIMMKTNKAAMAVNVDKVVVMVVVVMMTANKVVRVDNTAAEAVVMIKIKAATVVMKEDKAADMVVVDTMTANKVDTAAAAAAVVVVVVVAMIKTKEVAMEEVKVDSTTPPEPLMVAAARTEVAQMITLVPRTLLPSMPAILVIMTCSATSWEC
jgi:hypothetical protein